jgi:hypothetical protein
VRHLDRLRLADLFTRAYEAAEREAVTYTYRDRSYRVRTVAVTIVEMHTSGGGWVPLTVDLADQLLCKIESGEATRP